LILLTAQGKVPAWMVIIVLARELSVDGLRMVASLKGRVIAAGKLGKIKTVSQMAAISLAIIHNWPFGVFPMKEILSYVMVAFTLWSGVDYFIKNRSVLSAKEA
jgi:CDP-diacylglycerol--glycerol-3-phosphate 3-phosphatidyltransferase